MRLKDKAAIITGAGSGIGRACAVMFAREGAKVVVAGRRQSAIDETAEIIRKNNGDALAVSCDVSEGDQVRQLIECTVKSFGRIDILFNNAGVGYSSPYFMGPVKDTPEKDWDSVVDINLKSVYLTCHYAIPYMIQRGGGVILNCSSINGVVGCGADAYSAAKGGINALTRALAFDNGKYNIRVNTLSPGATETPMIQEALRQKEFYDHWSQCGPLKGIIQPEDVAYAAVFLTSDESRFITGQNLLVDCGFTAV
jgi:NAD(P)-dependent dehydrogenase (short-subunit alcohol dehydrogenase family)